jgi:hypothetical protein
MSETHARLRRGGLSAEQTFLLLGARTRCAAPHVQAARALLDHGLDWQTLLQLASENQVLPLLHHALEVLDDGERAPDDVRRKLARVYEASVLRGRRMQADLADLLRALGAAGVRAQVLKGLALGELVYRDPALRDAVDIDVLVQEGDFAAVAAALAGLGYALHRPLPALAPRDLVHAAHFLGQIRFCAPDHAPVETHFRLVNMGVPKDEPGVWERACRAQLAGVETLVPGPSDQLLLLCVHANTHGYQSLRLLCDVAEHLQQYRDEIDWSLFTTLVRRRRMAASAWFTLRFAAELLGAEVPERCMAEIRPSKLRRRVFEIAWGKDAVLGLRSLGRPGRVEGPRYYLLEVDGLADKIRFLGATLFPPREWLGRYYGPGRGVGLYLRHWRTALS